jgi:hypothetical protein
MTAEESSERVMRTAWPKRVIHFAVVLPERLGLEDRWVWDLHEDHALADLDSFALPPEPKSDTANEVASSRLIPRPYDDVFASRVVHHLITAKPRGLDLLDVAADAVRRIGDGRFGLKSESIFPDEAMLVGYSVLEVAVPLPDTGDDEAAGDALPQAIRAVQQLQGAYHRACHEPVTLMTPERLPALVPAFIREHNDHAADTDYPYSPPDQPFFVAVNLHEWVGLPGAGEEPIDIRRLEIGLRRTLDRGAFHALTEFRREATAAFWLTGDHRAVITWTATAAELLLNEVLQSLMWEEGRRPEDCVGDFTNINSIVKRVKVLYPARLGGNWVIHHDSQGPIAEWYRGITKPRNDIMHSGYNPTRDEAERALKALEGLVVYIGDLLVTKVDRYPRTAWMLVGQDGFERRTTTVPPAVQHVLNDPAEIPWDETLQRWRACHARCRADRDVPRIPSIAKSYLYAVFDGDRVSWCVHDRTTSLAAVVDFESARLPRRMRETFDAMRQDFLKDAVEPVTVAHPMQVYDGPEPTDWVEEYRLIPMATVMVDQSDRSAT